MAFKGFDTKEELLGACEAVGALLDALGFAQMAKDCRSQDGNLTRYARVVVNDMRRANNPKLREVETRLRALTLI